jgi:hypothetical protein
MSAYRLIPFVLAFIWLAVGVWFCSRSPLWLARFTDRHVRGDTDISGYPQVHREFFAYIRQHPESWHLRYALLFRMIRLTGGVAFTILAVGILMMYLVSVGLAKVYG